MHENTEREPARNQHDKRKRQRTRQRIGERESDAQGQQGTHGLLRSEYPTPRTVWMRRTSSGPSIFARMYEMYVSTVDGVTSLSRPHTKSMSSSRVKTRLGRRASIASKSNSRIVVSI